MDQGYDRAPPLSNEASQKISELVGNLVRAGADPAAAAVAVTAAFVAGMSAMSGGQSGGHDPAAERRRKWDRERKKAKRVARAECPPDVHPTQVDTNAAKAATSEKQTKNQQDRGLFQEELSTRRPPDTENSTIYISSSSFTDSPKNSESEIGNTRARKKIPKPPSARGTLCPDDFKPSRDHYKIGIQKGLSVSQVDEAARQMIEWSAANANRPIARKARWDLAFNNWLRKLNAKDFRRDDTGRNSILDAQDKLIATLASFDEPTTSFADTDQGTLERSGGEGAPPVRLLPEGGRERSGDLHSGDHGDFG